MRDLLEGIERWRAGGRQVALARLVDVEGSGPRLPGAAMAVNDEKYVGAGAEPRAHSLAALDRTLIRASPALDPPESGWRALTHGSGLAG